MYKNSNKHFKDISLTHYRIINQKYLYFASFLISSSCHFYYLILIKDISFYWLLICISAALIKISGKIFELEITFFMNICSKPHSSFSAALMNSLTLGDYLIFQKIFYNEE